jgi:hypothetical protein
MSENVGASTSYNPKGLHGLYTDDFFVSLIINWFHDTGIIIIIIIIIIKERCSRMVKIPALYSGDPGSNLGLETCYSYSGFCGFRQTLQTNSSALKYQSLDAI